MPMPILTERTPARQSFFQHLPGVRVIQVGRHRTRRLANWPMQAFVGVTLQQVARGVLHLHQAIPGVVDELPAGLSLSRSLRRGAKIVGGVCILRSILNKCDATWHALQRIQWFPCAEIMACSYSTRLKNGQTSRSPVRQNACAFLAPTCLEHNHTSRIRKDATTHRTAASI